MLRKRNADVKTKEMKERKKENIFLCTLKN